MSKTGQLWLETYDEIFKAFYHGEIDGPQVVERLRRLGFTEHDVDAHLECLVQGGEAVEAHKVLIHL